MVLMMGSADALPEAPKEKVMFMEDMSEQQLATAVRKINRILQLLFTSIKSVLPYMINHLILK